MEGCDIHFEETVSAATALGRRLYEVPMTPTIPLRVRPTTVQGELDAAGVAFDRDLWARAFESGPCPLCPQGGPRVRYTAHPSVGHPLFFCVDVQSPEEVDNEHAKPPTLSPSVAAYDGTYRLVAVIYRVGPCHGSDTEQAHWVCHAFYPDCWHVLDSRVGLRAEHMHSYDGPPVGSATYTPSMMCFVREFDGGLDAMRSVEREEAREENARRLRKVRIVLLKESLVEFTSNCRMASEMQLKYIRSNKYWTPWTYP